MFSKTCEYGLRAVLFVADRSNQNQKVSLATIAEEINSPEAFTGKVLQQLTKHKILKSIKGPYGGFIIESEKLNQTFLSDIVTIFDGDSIYVGCGLGLRECNPELPCPLHFKFAEIRKMLKDMLENTSLAFFIDNDAIKSLIFKRQ